MPHEYPTYEFTVIPEGGEPYLVLFSGEDARMLAEYEEKHPDLDLPQFVHDATTAYCRSISIIRKAVREYLNVYSPHYWHHCGIGCYLEGSKMEVDKETLEKIKKALGIE